MGDSQTKLDQKSKMFISFKVGSMRSRNFLNSLKIDEEKRKKKEVKKILEKILQHRAQWSL